VKELLSLIRAFNKKEYESDNDETLYLNPIDSLGYERCDKVEFQIEDGKFFLIFYDWSVSASHEKARFEFKLKEE